MQPAPLPCVICGTVPEPVFPDGPVFTAEVGAPTQPYRATVFFSRGQYGSTVYDPMRNNQRLEINICDSCLTHAARVQRRIALVRHLYDPTKQYSWEEWDPDGNSE